jgi:DNA polymerase III subunit epsilon
MTNGYLVIDTETSGLFDFKKPADDPSQPRLAALAMIWTDDEGNALQREKHFVRPDGWSMQAEASRINGLTDDFLTENGIAIGEVLDRYEAEVRDRIPVAAYNAQFDCKMMRGEFRRAGRDDLFMITHNTCLMRASNKLGAYGFQSATRGWPKLKEVAAFFGHEGYDEHDAMADAEAARVVLANLIRIGELIPPQVHFAKSKAS